jgi:heptosyltransferase-2
MQHLLVIRGGAVGDVILTLPALRALRQACPHAVLEVMGDPSRLALARHPAYSVHCTDLDSWDLYRLFHPTARASESLMAYLRSFDAIIAYLPGNNTTFAAHLQRYCPGQVVVWPPHPPDGVHATEHLLQPVVDLLPGAYDTTPRVYLDTTTVEAAEAFWRTVGLPARGVVGLHPGSGGAHKLWPVAGWRAVLAWAAQQGLPCLVISGPAEAESLTRLLQEPHLPPWPCARQLPLPHLAAVLARCQVVLGHDSGITHLAAAVGTTTLALFGPTHPLMWGPRSQQAGVLWPHPPGPLTLESLPPARVIDTLHAVLRGTFPFTPSRVDCTIVRLPAAHVTRESE